MGSRSVALLAVALALACGLPEQDGGVWKLEREEGGYRVEALAEADHRDGGRARLRFECTSAGASLVVDPGSLVTEQVGNPGHAQLYLHFDEGDQEVVEAELTWNHDILWPAPVQATRRLPSHDKVRVQWLGMAFMQEATFDLTGIDAPLQQAMDACGWPNP